jgi:hypothetical protein
MRYMVIETFRPGRAGDIYRRLERDGRHMPAGLTYIGSWITDDLSRCYQVMECNDRELLADWMSHWADLMDFEVIPVISSDEARARAIGNAPH